jgi:hypothetical protein
MRRLNILAPPRLAGEFIQNTIVNLNIDLDAKECAETGKGMFTWLLRVDKKANTLVTGGSPPANDPFGLGFCFVDLNISGIEVKPLTTKIEFTGKSFHSTEPRDVNIPIFLSKTIGDAIILPISQVLIQNVTIADDSNCIGHFDSVALDQTCTEDRNACPKWKTAGSLAGFITLEAADTVFIRELSFKSLCAYIAGEQPLRCDRDANGKIKFVGDYCSTTKEVGGCKDSVWLAATFTASAAKIYDGRGKDPGCSGAATGDAGAKDAGDGG